MNSTTVLVIYLLFSWSISALLHKDKSIIEKDRIANFHKLLFFSIPALAVGFYFVALRPFNAGGDTVPYILAYNRISSPLTATQYAMYGNELLFWPVQAIIKNFVEVRGWLISNYLIIALLSFFSYKKVTQHTKISPFLFALVFMTFFSVYTGNAMRQVYAVPLGLMAFYYCFQKNYFKYLLLLAAAIFFHWSAVIFLLSPLFSRLPNKLKYYIAIPIIAVLSSFLLTNITHLLADLTGFEWFTFKENIYINGGRVSHIEEVWKTFNFWLCILMYLSLVLTRIVLVEEFQNITKYLLMFISIMLFTVGSPDISERYMVSFIFLTPLITAIIIQKVKIDSTSKSFLYAILFLLMAGLVYTRPSAIVTLGIN
ncbi:hypothetical protein PS862_01353 [Pseudomonas fluorescens]|uniref:EpsG family protein n=1 Tax=Pseudomonas fluorescens TaxID=294 RepID=A0A5E7I3M8_PSEFL|nr:EpsG family protein [Pseudomonas fluorescens]VVO71341.1 hypothetical protein PS862_01353 [Pseudomonas fluorescens]